MFNSISTFDNDGAWRNCLSMTDEPNRPLSLARSLYDQSEKLFAFYDFGEVEIYDTIEEMEKSQKLYRGRSLAFQKRYVGDEILKSLLFEAEQLDMESVWVCIDHYTSSMNVLRIESNVVERKERVLDEDKDDVSLEEIDEGVDNGEDGEDSGLEEEEEERVVEDEVAGVVEDKGFFATYREVLLRQNASDAAGPNESSTLEEDAVGGDGEVFPVVSVVILRTNGEMEE
jgi:hypothetical protein